MGAKMANARNRKKRRISLANGESAPAPIKAGRPPREDATRVAIDARLRVANLTDTPEHRRDMQSNRQGCAIGRAIEARGGNDLHDLWNAVCHMRQAFAAYYRATGIPAPHAKVASILAPTEATETSADAPPADLRTDEEKSRAAVSSYMHLQGWLGHTDAHAASCARQAVIFAPDDPIRDMPAVIRALQCVVDGMAGKRGKLGAK
jgi:hypothetical protein